MKAARWHAKNDVRVEEIPEPSPAQGEVKIKVHWCGICGTDLHEYLEGPIFLPVDTPHPLTGKKTPLTLGHEFSGEISKLGEGVKELQIGDQVTAWPARVCGECYWCRKGEPVLCEKIASIGLMTDGAFAEYVIVPSSCIYKLPPGVSTDNAALTEPMAVGVHAMRKGGITPGDNVVVVGAGTIGLVTIQAARVSGARTVTAVEIAPAKKELAKKLGADVVLDPTEVDVTEEVFQATEGVGADLAFECVGIQETLNTTMNVIRRGGKGVIIGIFEKEALVDMMTTVFFEKQIIGSFAYNDEFSAVLSYLRDGRFVAEPMISKKISLDDIVEHGFKELFGNKDKYVKILVSPQGIVT